MKHHSPTTLAKFPRWLVTALVLTGMLWGSIGPAAAQTPEPPRRADEQAALPDTGRPADAPEYAPGVILVKFQDAAIQSTNEALMAQYGATYQRNLYSSDVQVWQVPEGQELDIIQALEASGQVVYAEPDYIYYLLGTPNDPGYSQQWAQPLINADDAWDLTTGSAAVVIAIIDTGVDLNHPDLAGKIVAGYDFIDGDNTPSDPHGHGTHVAGIAAAIGNNGVGIAGNDWNARIMPVRVMDTTGHSVGSSITDGINWARLNGARVLNLSVGGYSSSTAMQNAVTAAYNAGAIVIAAMGNDSTSAPSYPAAYANVVAVAATTRYDTHASYSNYGAHCDIAAPGGDGANPIYSTLPGNNYGYASGTSMASPQVAGLAALLFGVNPDLTPLQVQDTIQSTAVDLGTAGWDSSFGWGRIDALAAVQKVSGPAAPVLSAISNADHDGTYLVNWNDVSDATSYTLEVDDNGNFTSPTTAYSGATSQHQVTGQAAGLWYYRVRASNAIGTSAWSATQTAGVVPGAPALNNISNPSNLDAYTITWGTVSGASGYRLEEDDNASFTSPTVRYQGASRSYNVTGQAGGIWYYRALAYNNVGDGAWSSTKNTSVTASGISAPTLNPIVNGGESDSDMRSYTVDWTDVVSATAYILEESRSPYFDVIENTHNVTTSTLTLADQGSGTWHYRVRAVVDAAYSPWSNARSVVVDAITHMPSIFRRAGFGILLAEGFEDGVVPPSGWTHIQTNANETWKIGTAGSPYTGSYFASVNFAGTVENPEYQNEVLLSPQFSAESATLSFYSFGSLYWCRDTYDNCDLNVWVVVGNWGGTDDVLVYTADEDWIATYEWANSSVDLSPYISSSTPVRIAFQYDGYNGAQVSLDDISITVP